MWDYHISESTIDYKELALQALEGPLSKQQEMQLIEALKISPDLVYEWMPENVPSLVEFCPTLALEALSLFSTNLKGRE